MGSNGACNKQFYRVTGQTCVNKDSGRYTGWNLPICDESNPNTLFVIPCVASRRSSAPSSRRYFLRTKFAVFILKLTEAIYVKSFSTLCVFANLCVYFLYSIQLLYLQFASQVVAKFLFMYESNIQQQFKDRDPVNLHAYLNR